MPTANSGPPANFAKRYREWHPRFNVAMKGFIRELIALCQQHVNSPPYFEHSAPARAIQVYRGHVSVLADLLGALINAERAQQGANELAAGLTVLAQVTDEQLSSISAFIVFISGTIEFFAEEAGLTKSSEAPVHLRACEDLLARHSSSVGALAIEFRSFYRNDDAAEGNRQTGSTTDASPETFEASDELLERLLRATSISGRTR